MRCWGCRAMHVVAPRHEQANLPAGCTQTPARGRTGRRSARWWNAKKYLLGWLQLRWAGEQAGCSPFENSILALNYWSNITRICLPQSEQWAAPGLSRTNRGCEPTQRPQRRRTHPRTLTHKWGRHNQLNFSMLLIFLPICFYYKLKKESHTIRNCSSNSPFPRGQHRKQVIASQ